MDVASSPAVIIRAEGHGERRWFVGGGVHVWKARSEETAGAFLLFEDRMAGGKMTPVRTHPDSDDIMYILEGETIMHLDGADHRIGAGSLAVVPRVPHAFMVVSESARMLCPHAPGCCEAFYWDASTPLSDEDLTGAGPVDMGKVQESARKNGGITLLGPPPCASS